MFRMAITLYDISIPLLLRGCASLKTVLEKGRVWAEEQGVPQEALLAARLKEDMAPLTAQVQRVSDTAKGAGARLAAIEAPGMPDTEASFAELQARIDATVAFLQSIAPEQVNGREDAQVELKTPNRSFQFTARDYVATFALPNFYFHVTTAYAILRVKGVPLGKMDYLGGL
jgi:uncharacterized protein